MTKKELIEKLSGYPDDWVVVVDSGDECLELLEVTEDEDEQGESIIVLEVEQEIS